MVSNKMVCFSFKTLRSTFKVIQSYRSELTAVYPDSRLRLARLTPIKLLIDRLIYQTNRKFSYIHLSIFHPFKNAYDLTKRKALRVIVQSVLILFSNVVPLDTEPYKGCAYLKLDIYNLLQCPQMEGYLIKYSGSIYISTLLDLPPFQNCK